MLRDFETAPIAEGLRATLRLLQQITLMPEDVGDADVAAVRAAGVDVEQIRDAIYVGVCFNIITRLADAFRFELLDQAGYDASARALLRFGYKL